MARTIALDHQFFMIDGKLRSDLALEAFKIWVQLPSHAGNSSLKNLDAKQILRDLEYSDDPVRLIREWFMHQASRSALIQP